MKQTKISIVTPSFNSIHTIRDTIESVRIQNYSNWEHIVFDGGSKDGTLDILKEYPHLIWVSEKDEGHYHAMNKGIQKATGDVVNILNSDDCLRPNAMAEVAQAFESHPDWDGLFGDIVYVDGKGNEIFRREEAIFDYDVLRYSGVCYVIHQTLFVKKTVHDRLGLYRHKQFLNCCDYDFILKMGRENCRVGHVPRLLINYRIHDFGQTADRRVQMNMAKESTIIRREHGVSDGLTGKIFRAFYRGKRQFQKLRYRGKCDWMPATYAIRRHTRAKTSFSSNCGVDKL